MICLVTDRRRLSADSTGIDRLVDLVAAAAQAGIDVVQVRERDLDARALSELVCRCLAVVEGGSTKVVVNDRVDVAVATGAHGVHLRGDSVGIPAARSLLHARALIGRSVHGPGDAGAASGAGADYLIFGSLYETASKDPGHRLASLDELREVCRAAAGVPVLAIGGMTLQRAPEAARAGAAGIAGIGLFVPSAGVSAERHVRAVAGELRRSFDTCGSLP